MVARPPQQPARSPAIADPVPVGIAGYVSITCGVTAWYVAFAHVTNATFGRELVPTWPLGDQHGGSGGCGQNYGTWHARGRRDRHRTGGQVKASR